MAAAVPKNWPYKRIFDIKLQRLLESGTVDSIRRHWQIDLPDCKKVEEDEDSLALGPGVHSKFCLEIPTVTLHALCVPEKLISLFIMPGLGYIVSLIIFTIEVTRNSQAKFKFKFTGH